MNREWAVRQGWTTSGTGRPYSNSHDSLNRYQRELSATTFASGIMQSEHLGESISK